MKVFYKFDLDNEDSDDLNKLKLFQNASNMYLALSELDDIKRKLYKGYAYYDPKEEMNEDEDNKYQRIDVNTLLDDLCEILSESGYYEIN